MRKLINDLNLPKGKVYVHIPMVVSGQIVIKDFIIEESSLLTVSKAKLLQRDYFNYELVWDYSYFMSDDNKAYQKGLEQENEINSLISELQ